MPNTVCNNCGLIAERWFDQFGKGKGYTKEGEIYCCCDCAENRGCLCVANPEYPEDQAPEPAEGKDLVVTNEGWTAEEQDFEQEPGNTLAEDEEFIREAQREERRRRP